MNPIATDDLVTPTPDFESGRLSWADRAARRLLLARLQNLSGGRLTLADAAGICELGGVSEGDLSAEVRVHRPRFYRQALWGGAWASPTRTWPETGIAMT